MTNTISEDMSGKGTSREQTTAASLGRFPAGPVPTLAYIPSPKTEQEHRNNQDHSFQLMLLEQENVRRRQMAVSQDNTYLQRHDEPDRKPFTPGPPPRVADNLHRPDPFAPGPVPCVQYPLSPVYPDNAPSPLARHHGSTPGYVESYNMSPQYSNTSHPNMYTPPSQGSISIAEANNLKAQITALQDKVRELEGKPAVTTASKYQILYRIEKDGTYPGDDNNAPDGDDEFRPRPPRGHTQWSNSPPRSPWMGIYTDPPELIHRNMGAPYLRCNDPLINFELYLALNREISFVIFRNFKRRVEHQPHNTKCDKPEPFSETILPVCETLKDVIRCFLRGREFQSMESDFQQKGEVQSPYLFIYHNRGAKESEIKRSLSSEAQRQCELFMNYVQETCGSEYAAADLLLEKGKFRPEYVQYLFKPKDILVSTKNKEHIGYVAKEWPVRGQNIRDASPFWHIGAQTWGFDGDFYKIVTKLRFEMPESQHSQESKSLRLDHLLDELNRLPSYNNSDKDPEKEYAITDLAVYPVKYAPDHIVRKLQRRGEIFWKFRTQQYVSYQATEEENFQTMVCSCIRQTYVG